MNVLGIDVGFSKTRASTGLCIAGPGAPEPWCATTDFQDRIRNMPKDVRFSVVAIDGPVVPMRVGKTFKRLSETILASGPFQKRCKPGFTHFGKGQDFRAAANATVQQFDSIASEKSSFEFPRIIENRNFVEAFPNAFLGVQLPDELYAARPKLKRGQKFDWLYERWLEKKLHIELQKNLKWDDSQFCKQLEANRNHDQRAALICALTAICVVRGRFAAVGDNHCGRIFLPSLESWAPWARAAIEFKRDFVIEGPHQKAVPSN